MVVKKYSPTSIDSPTNVHRIGPYISFFLGYKFSLKKGEAAMKCKKCNGLMVLQSFFDHFLNFDGWKCLNCGKIEVKKEKTIEFDAFSIFYQQQRCKNRG